MIPQYTTFFTELFLPELAWPSNAMGEEHVMDRSRKIALVAAEDARKRKALDVLEKQAQIKKLGLENICDIRLHCTPTSDSFTFAKNMSSIV